ncbi:hypothetical protein ESCO_000010 [Escovopsis weberi]|uniref:SMODS and SLOG-associating 2TM effector domain-containing protein n=1 Tax=Escovopsis weberi TaxID=150374 RepID=A0A0M8MXF5_ESCWE|nr:hypothetical protein ESCO_000010 [Escovopsis weberi]
MTINDTIKGLAAGLARAGLSKLAAVAPPSDVDAADLEKQQQRPPRQQPFRERSEEDRQRLAIVGTGHETLIPTNDKLLAYQTLTGFDTAPVLLSAGHAGRAAPNIGLHARVVSAERETGRRYRRYHLLINFCLGAQIVVGAALTALGAAKGSRRAITAFAAINTIMAAILTYLKGSGLPDRYRAQEHG